MNEEKELLLSLAFAQNTPQRNGEERAEPLFNEITSRDGLD